MHLYLRNNEQNIVDLSSFSLQENFYLDETIFQTEKHTLLLLRRIGFCVVEVVYIIHDA